MKFRRGSGILLHVTSLPGPHGIGSLGREAFGFADWLVDAGQRFWEILPVNPIGYGNSPYPSPSDSDLTIISLQDILGLVSEARMNAPGQAAGSGRGASGRGR
jgi:4-alpha-glucanotransferase